jgi:hypothetical protein
VEVFWNIQSAQLAALFGRPVTPAFSLRGVLLKPDVFTLPSRYCWQNWQWNGAAPRWQPLPPSPPVPLPDVLLARTFRLRWGSRNLELSAHPRHFVVN